MLLGLIYTSMGDNDKAITCLTEALDATKNNLSDGVLKAHLHSHMAQALQGAGRHVDAITHLERAAAIFEKAGASGARGTCLTVLGEIHRDLGDIDRARRCWEEVVRLLDGTPFKMAFAHAKRSLAQTS